MFFYRAVWDRISLFSLRTVLVGGLEAEHPTPRVLPAPNRTVLRGQDIFFFVKDGPLRTVPGLRKIFPAPRTEKNFVPRTGVRTPDPTTKMATDGGNQPRDPRKKSKYVFS